VRHENVNSLDRYIQKHNEYSNWEASVLRRGTPGEIRPKFWGTQAQRRRWLKRVFLRFPGSPLFFFFYKYFFRLGFLDGVPGLIYCCFQSIQIFHVKAKLFEMLRGSTTYSMESSPGPEILIRESDEQLIHGGADG
jgi:hypothetical protein